MKFEFMNDIKTELIAEASRIEESAMWSSQGQFESAKIWTIWNWVSGGVTAICSGVSGLLTFATDGLQVISGVLAVVAAIFVGVHTVMKPDSRAEIAQKSANEYLDLQGEARRIKNLGEYFLTDEEYETKLQNLASVHSSISKRSYPIPYVAYKITSWNIRKGRQNYSADEPDNTVNFLDNESASEVYLK